MVYVPSRLGLLLSVLQAQRVTLFMSVSIKREHSLILRPYTRAISAAILGFPLAFSYQRSS